MKLHNLVGTIGFKLSALYLGLFLASFLAVSVSVYWWTYQILEQQIRNGIETEINRLKAEYDSGGIAELKDEIDELIGSKSQSAFTYGVMDSTGRLVAGSFDNFQLVEGWQIVTRTQSASKQDEKSGDIFYFKVISLPHNAWLGIGQHGGTVQGAGHAIFKALTEGFVLMIFLGSVGGWFISRTFLKKIERITSSTEKFMAGDLKHRLPVSNRHDELDRLTIVLNAMLDQIGRLIENIQQVSNDIAHDLRTPISHLKFRLEDALKRRLTPDQYQQRIILAIEEVDSILATFSALLRISQITSGSRRSGFQAVDLSAVVHAVIEALNPVSEDNGKSIHATIERGVQLIGDKELLTQMAYNLVENAIIHSYENSQIDVDLRSSGNLIEFIVADHGPGIPEEDRLKVFQRFYRLDHSRTTPGNGLGLSIVSAIVDLHAGTIALNDNHPGLRVVIKLFDMQSQSA